MGDNSINISKHNPVNRRTLITGAAVAGIGAPLLAACGSSSTDSSSTGSSPETNQPATPSASGKSENKGGAALTKTSDVPVGGGIVLSQAVITQPTAGQFRAFNPACPHQGCPVSKVENDKILCPCHGSEFSIKDGSVERGPAKNGLTPITISTKNGEIFTS